MKVSVLVLAYNHERFVAQTLDSVLMQQVGFDWEVVIGEDCSTDGTAAIVRRYADRHPDRIRVLPRERNLGMHRNFADAWAACRGQYVAILEADDYWTSPTKLSRQAEFLDARPDYTECFTDVEVFHEDGSRPRRRLRPPAERDTWRLLDVLEWNFVPQCSVMFRRGVVAEWPAWFYGIPLPDWSLHLLHAERGPIGYIPEVTAAYRLHPGGIHRSRGGMDGTDGNRSQGKPQHPSGAQADRRGVVSRHSGIPFLGRPERSLVARAGLQREQFLQLEHHGEGAGHLRAGGRRPQPRVGHRL